MDFFKYSNDRLYCENASVSKIAKEFGTPLYVYSLKTILRHFEVIKKAFGEIDHLICYAAKANSNLAILKMAKLCGAGADVVSGGELKLALKSGIRPKKIVFSGVGKSNDEIEFAIKNRILFISAESIQELETIAGIARKLKLLAPVSIRVNPDIDPKTHPYIATGLKETKFGISEKAVYKAYHFCKENRWLDPVGISMHIGSQIEYVQPYYDAAKKIVDLYNKLRKEKIEIKYIDIGGGWAAQFGFSGNLPGPDDYVAAISGLFEGLPATVIVEPGRSIIGNAGLLVMKVIVLKQSGGRSFCVVDAGMNDFIRPALYGGQHEIGPLIRKSGPKILYDIVGPICESSDYFAKERKLQKLRVGDYLALFTAGAYGMSMSSNYNSRLRPAEIAVAGRDVFVIREREKNNDLTRGQRMDRISSSLIDNLKRNLKV